MFLAHFKEFSFDLLEMLNMYELNWTGRVATMMMHHMHETEESKAYKKQEHDYKQELIFHSVLHRISDVEIYDWLRPLRSRTISHI